MKTEADGPDRSPEQQYLCHSILKLNMQHLKYIFRLSYIQRIDNRLNNT